MQRNRHAPGLKIGPLQDWMIGKLRHALSSGPELLKSVLSARHDVLPEGRPVVVVHAGKHHMWEKDTGSLITLLGWDVH